MYCLLVNGLRLLHDDKKLSLLDLQLKVGIKQLEGLLFTLRHLAFLAKKCNYIQS